jgi:hypothetical protein
MAINEHELNKRPELAPLPESSKGPARGFFDWDVTKASLQDTNEVGSYIAGFPSRLSKLKNQLGREIDVNFEPDIEGFEEYYKEFIHDNTPEEVELTKADITRELHNKEVLSNLDWGGKVNNWIFGGLLSPTSLFQVAGSTAVYSAAAPLGPAAAVGLTAAASGLEAAGITTVKEKLLHDSQRFRSFEDSVANVKASAIIGTVLGGLGAGVAQYRLKRAQESVKDFVKDIQPPLLLEGPDGSIHPAQSGNASAPGYVPSPDKPTPGGGGAPMNGLEPIADIPNQGTDHNAYRYRYKLDTTAIDKARDAQGIAHLGDHVGKLTKVMGQNTSILTDGLQSDYTTTREVIRDLFENNLIANEHASGKTRGPALESLMNLRHANLNQVREKIHDIYYESEGIQGKFKASKSLLKTRQAKKEGDLHHLDKKTFDFEVMKSLRRDDVSRYPQVQKAAQLIRKELIEPLKKELIKLRVFSPDVSTKTAASYILRAYNKEMIVQYRDDFEEIQRKTFRDRNERLQKGEKIYTDEGMEFVKAAEQAKAMNDPKLAAAYTAEADKHLERILSETELNMIAQSMTDNILQLNAKQVVQQQAADLGVNLGASPTKQRVNPTLDIDQELFLVNDLDRILSTYHRSLSKLVELKNFFNRQGFENVEGLLEKLHGEYRHRRQGLTDKQELKRLKDRYTYDAQLIQDSFDILVGTYDLNSRLNDFAAISRNMRVFNYITKNGGVVISALPDLVQPIIAHGIKAWVQPGLTPLLSIFTKNNALVKIDKALKDELRIFGIGMESIASELYMELASLDDPFSTASRTARTLDTLSSVAGHVFVINQFTDLTRRTAGVMSMNHTLNTLDAYHAAGGSPNDPRIAVNEVERLATLGIGIKDYAKIISQYHKHRSKMDDVWVPNLENWTADARTLLGAAVLNETNSTAVRVGKGDLPRFMHRETGKLFGQFKSIFFAFYNKLTLNSLQRRDAYVLQGVAAILFVGAVGYMVRKISYGEMPDMSINNLAQEAVYNSGILGLPLELMQTLHKTKALPVAALAIDQILPGTKEFYDDNFKGVSRYSSRDPIGALLGPTYGTASDAINLLGELGNNGLSVKAVDQARRMIPFNNTMYIRYLFQEGSRELARELGADEGGSSGQGKSIKY